MTPEQERMVEELREGFRELTDILRSYDNEHPIVQSYIADELVELYRALPPEFQKIWDEKLRIERPL